MIFGKIRNESLVQVGDMTRIDASATFITPDEASITLYEIQPAAGEDFFDVTTNKRLDWAYTADGEKTITLRITTDGAPETFTSSIEVITAADDRLFSSDSDLVQLEDDILKYLRPGRSSYLDKHREAQSRILDQLDLKRIYDSEGNRLTAADLANLDEVKQWSKYLTAQIIYETLVSDVDDVFSQKVASYRQLVKDSSNRAALTLQEDTDGDGSITELEKNKIDLQSGRLVRR